MRGAATHRERGAETGRTAQRRGTVTPHGQDASSTRMLMRERNHRKRKRAREPDEDTPTPDRSRGDPDSSRAPQEVVHRGQGQSQTRAGDETTARSLDAHEDEASTTAAPKRSREAKRNSPRRDGSAPSAGARDEAAPGHETRAETARRARASDR
ncbi:hypothetical protein Tco_0088645 [Tanacetum coccineum]